jgi:hypothetical protein
VPSKKFRARSSERYNHLLAKALDEGSYSESQTTQILRLLMEGISAQEWKEISRLSGLAEHRRFELNQGIRIYWDSKLEERRDPETKDQIKETRKCVKELDALLEKLQLNPDFYNGVFPFYDASPMEQRESLEKGYIALLELDRTLAKAEIRLSRNAGRPTFGPIYTFIRFLDVILASEPGKFALTANKMNPDRSANSKAMAVIKIVQIAEPKVKQSAIEDILKRYVRRRSQWGSDVVLQTA